MGRISGVNGRGECIQLKGVGNRIEQGIFIVDDGGKEGILSGNPDYPHLSV